jgi:hypothetical protein
LIAGRTDSLSQRKLHALLLLAPLQLLLLLLARDIHSLTNSLSLLSILLPHPSAYCSAPSLTCFATAGCNCYAVTGGEAVGKGLQLLLRRRRRCFCYSNCFSLRSRGGRAVALALAKVRLLHHPAGGDRVSTPHTQSNGCPSLQAGRSCREGDCEGWRHHPQNWGGGGYCYSNFYIYLDKNKEGYRGYLGRLRQEGRWYLGRLRQEVVVGLFMWVR